MTAHCRRPETICGYDVDDLFAYETAKSVRIRDHRLGCTYYAALFGVCVYIGVYSLAHNLAYLQFWEPSGVVRLKLQEPVQDNCNVDDPTCLDAFPDTSELPYCCKPGCRPAPQGGSGACSCGARRFLNYACAFHDGDTISSSESGSIFIGTRLRIQQEQINASCIAPGATTCTKLWSWTSNPIQYVAGIEDFTLLVDHAAQVAELDFFQQARYLSGLLHVPGNGAAEMALCARPGSMDAYHGGRATTAPPCWVEPFHPVNQSLDYFTLDMLLAAAGVDLDGESYKGSNHPVRFEGMTMVINIHYFNAVPWKGLLSTPGYYYEVTAMRENSYGQHTVIWGPARTNRTLLAMHGIFMQANVMGQIAGFSFNSLLLQLTASLALLAAATSGVNCLAKYALKYRTFYSAALVDETADFSFVAALEAMSTEALRAACQQRNLPAGGTRVQLISRLLMDGFEIQPDGAAGAGAAPANSVEEGLEGLPLRGPSAAAKARAKSASRG